MELFIAKPVAVLSGSSSNFNVFNVAIALAFGLPTFSSVRKPFRTLFRSLADADTNEELYEFELELYLLYLCLRDITCDFSAFAAR
jgi:hypothetical protein